MPRYLLALLLIASALPMVPAAAGDVSTVHAISLIGEPKYGPDFKHLDYVNPDAPKGGEIKLQQIGGFDSFNGYIIKGDPGPSSSIESLLTDTDDDIESGYGLIAESIELPADRSWVAFNLRPQARWQDGQSITVEDVIFSFNILKEKGRPFFRAYYANVVKAEKVGERKVKFTFSAGQNRELPVILGQLPVLPKHYWESRDFEQPTLEPPLGSGPYKVESFDAGRSITLRRVEDYWGKDLPINVGRNNWDVIHYDFYRDETVALEAFKAGAYDFRSENTAKVWATGYDFPAIRDGRVIKEKIPNELPMGMQGFAYNIRHDIFKDPKVRQALAYAFDFEWSNKALFYGEYTRTRSYFANSELASSGLPEAEELQILEKFRGRIPEEVFTTEYRPPTTDGSGNARANLRKAAELLKAAGWEVKNGRLTNGATGNAMEFELLLDNPAFERVVQPFVQNLDRLGVKARIRTVDSAQYQNRMDDFDFDMTVGGFGESLSPGNEQREFWSSQSANTRGSRNIIGIKDPAIDELVELVISAPNRESLIARTHALDRVLLWGHYVIPNWHLPAFRVAYWSKLSHPKATPKYGLGFDSWWIDPDKAKALQSQQTN